MFEKKLDVLPSETFRCRRNSFATESCCCVLVGKACCAANAWAQSVNNTGKVSCRWFGICYKDGPGEAVVAALEQTTETPELVWTSAMAASLSAQIATMASDLYREQMKGRVVDWDVPEQALGQQEMRDEPQVGVIYVRLFLKDLKFPLRNPKRFLEGLLDQYVSSVAAAHYDMQVFVDPKLPLLLSAALVSLLRVHPALADHVGFLGYVPKLVAAMAYEGRRETMSSGDIKNDNHISVEDVYEIDDGQSQSSVQTPQERVRLSCLRVRHQLAASTTCAEAMAATSVGTPQV